MFGFNRWKLVSLLLIGLVYWKFFTVPGIVLFSSDSEIEISESDWILVGYGEPYLIWRTGFDFYNKELVTFEINKVENKEEQIQNIKEAGMFFVPGGEIKLYDGCNNKLGGLEYLDDNEMNIAWGVTTFADCSGGFVSSEFLDKYFDGNEAYAYRIDGGFLVMELGDGKVLVFSNNER